MQHIFLYKLILEIENYMQHKYLYKLCIRESIWSLICCILHVMTLLMKIFKQCVLAQQWNYVALHKFKNI